MRLRSALRRRWRQELEAERDALRAALKPFSDTYERGVAGDIWPVSDQGAYRRAYKALARARGDL